MDQCEAVFRDEQTGRDLCVTFTVKRSAAGMLLGVEPADFFGGSGYSAVQVREIVKLAIVFCMTAQGEGDPTDDGRLSRPPYESPQA